MKKLVLALLSFTICNCFSADERYLDARKCSISCYEKGNDSVVFSTRCPDQPMVSITKDSAKISFHIKHSRFDAVYAPFDIIHLRKNGFSSCFINIEADGRAR